jgi:hypothetical protein
VQVTRRECVMEQEDAAGGCVYTWTPRGGGGLGEGGGLGLMAAICRLEREASCC